MNRLKTASITGTFRLVFLINKLILQACILQRAVEFGRFFILFNEVVLKTAFASERLCIATVIVF